MTIDEFMSQICEIAYREFADSEWYIQRSAIEGDVSLHVASGEMDGKVEGYKWMDSFIEHATPWEGHDKILEGVRSIARRTVIARG